MTHPRQRASDQLHSVLPIDPLLDHGIHTSSDHYAEDLLIMQSDGVIGIDKNGNIKFINKTACKLTGWLQADAKNQKLEKIFLLSNETSAESNLELINSVIDSGHLFGPIAQHTIKTKNNKNILVDFSISPLDDDTVILMFHQLRNDKQPKFLLYQVNHDPLTRLKNRDAIQQSLSLLHDEYKNSDRTYSIFLLDIDRFKMINDCYGHNAGDQLLQLIAERMQVHLRDKDNIGRWGGEEFICIMPDADIKTACNIAERLCYDISTQPFIANDQEISITASIGIANFPIDGDNPDELYRIADTTLYEAKKNGRNRIHSSRQSTGNIFSIGALLENALTENRITPVYQPIFELSSGKQVAEEALARIQEKNGQLIEANNFIDAAVELQMVHRIDYQIIKKMIMRCFENFTKTQNALPHFVNVSADLLRYPQLVKELIQFATKTCDECGFSQCTKKPIVIEITEQEFLSGHDDVNKILEKLNMYLYL